MMVIGAPGAGKTRMASFWPKPIYADIESARGSLSDRNMPYAEIKSSQDMLDFLEYLKGMQRVPKAQREYQTVVIDTLDGEIRAGELLNKLQRTAPGTAFSPVHEHENYRSWERSWFTLNRSLQRPQSGLLILS